VDVFRFYWARAVPPPSDVKEDEIDEINKFICVQMYSNVLHLDDFHI
jgi:hypothetical protein